jgi:hypothetical protein
MNILKLATLIIVAVAGLLIGALVQSRFGSAPSPVATPAAKPGVPVSVTEIRLVEPSREGDPYRLEATLRRDGPAGGVDVTFRLRNRTTGERIERAGLVEVQPAVALVVVAELAAPRADYTPEVEARSAAR